MKVDGRLSYELDRVGAEAQELEATGYDGAWCAESGHDPFLPLVPAALATQRLQIGTAIAVAFGRSPLSVATIGNDLQRASQGRLLLGLGTQVKAHIERRYSMPWSHPAARMREFISAVRAIWATWNDGQPLDFRGEFYTHTLMTPFFSPKPHHYGSPKVFLSAVGPRLTEVAGEVADGLLVHHFSTERYLREVTMPALERGLARSGRSRGDVQIAMAAMVVSGDDDEARHQSRREARLQIAFCGSTPAYRPVLERHGWGALGDELNVLSKQGRWKDMTGLIDDEVLDAFAVVAEPDHVATALADRFGGVLDRLRFYSPLEDHDPRTAAALVTIRAA